LSGGWDGDAANVSWPDITACAAQHVEAGGEVEKAAAFHLGGPDNLLSGRAKRAGSDSKGFHSKEHFKRGDRFLWPAATRTTSCPGHPKSID